MNLPGLSVGAAALPVSSAHNCCSSACAENAHVPCCVPPFGWFPFRDCSGHAAQSLAPARISMHAFIFNWCFETFFKEENLNQSYARPNS